MAIVQAIGKPAGIETFGDYANYICKSVLANFSDTFTRVDVIFDCYNSDSIKKATRQRRSRDIRSIRRIISGLDVKLPTSWKSFIALEANKVNLISFLAKVFLEKAATLPSNMEFVVAGGTTNEDVFTSHNRSVEHLVSNHEEADTRIILHARDASSLGYKRIVVRSSDTDVLVLLLYHDIDCEVWQNCGIAKKPRFLPVHLIRCGLNPDVREALPLFHALTGCDTTSQFCGYGKKSGWESSALCSTITGHTHEE